MFRDKHKTEAYFLDDKEFYFQALNRRLGRRDSIEEQYLSTYLFNLTVNYETLFKVCYSLGDGIDESFSYYQSSLKYFKDLVTGNSAPYRIIDYFAIGVLYSDRKSEFIDDLKVLYDNLVYTDDLIEYYAAYLFHDKVVPYRSALEYQNMIEDDFESVKKAQGFWYYAHADAPWYNSHKYDNRGYVGYWSFDTAALCKMRGIFDEQLQELDYFPYDLLVQG